jgi:hypothetical protein
MLLVSFDATHNLRPLVHDHLNNTGFVDVGQRVSDGVMTLAFESAAFDPDDDLDEANEHEEGVVLDGGEYAFIRTDLQQMAFDRDSSFLLTFSFKAHTGSDDDYFGGDEDNGGDEEATKLADAKLADDTRMKDDLREIFRILAEDN